MRKFYLGLASLLLLAGNVNATEIGYSVGINRNGGYRIGTSTKQGQAIRLSKAKLQHLKGKTIESANFILATKNTTGGTIHAFISTSLDGTPLVEGDCKIDRPFKASTWTLPEAYVITGEEENLYIGYTTETQQPAYKALLGDMANNIKGCTYAMDENGWIDAYDYNMGSAMISFNTKEDVEPYCDVIVNSLTYNKYYKAGNKYNFAAKFVNVGTKAITSFQTEVKVGDKTYTEDYNNVNVPAKSAYTFNLPEVGYDTEGNVDINISIKNINGGNDEIDITDNVDNGSMYFYPSYMERSILLEGFTGQDCNNCPGGHSAIASALNATDQNVVEIMHHAGYIPDMFTMEESTLYTMYYEGSTYAPAVMVNRTTDASIATAPVINTDANNIKRLINNAADNKPYVSLNLETKLNEETRELIVKFNVKPNEPLPTNKVLFNIYLMQNGVKASQSGAGINYTHNHIPRGSLVKNSWGLELPKLEVGETYTWNDTITIPEKIHASFWKESMLTSDGQFYQESVTSGKKSIQVDATNVEAVLKDMSVVAFVGEYNTTDKNSNKVFNCIETKLGTSHMQMGYDYVAGVETVDAQPNVGIYVNNGKVGVSGNYDKLYVYGISGNMVDANAKLDKGVYIVKVVANGKQTTKKILVR